MASIVLAVKAIAIPVLLFAVLRRTREQRLVAPASGPLVRLAGAGALALLSVARRPALLLLVGLIVAENGLSLLAVSVPGGLPYVIELGALLDLVLVVTVAAAFTHRIHGELGTGDTELLRGLRD